MQEADIEARYRSVREDLGLPGGSPVVAAAVCRRFEAEYGDASKLIELLARLPALSLDAEEQTNARWSWRRCKEKWELSGGLKVTTSPASPRRSPR